MKLAKLSVIGMAVLGVWSFAQTPQQRVSEILSDLKSDSPSCTLLAYLPDLDDPQDLFGDAWHGEIAGAAIAKEHQYSPSIINTLMDLAKRKKCRHEIVSLFLPLCVFKIIPLSRYTPTVLKTLLEIAEAELDPSDTELKPIRSKKGFTREQITTTGYSDFGQYVDLASLKVLSAIRNSALHWDKSEKTVERGNWGAKFPVRVVEATPFGKHIEFPDVYVNSYYATHDLFGISTGHYRHFRLVFNPRFASVQRLVSLLADKHPLAIVREYGKKVETALERYREPK